MFLLKYFFLYEKSEKNSILRLFIPEKQKRNFLRHTDTNNGRFQVIGFYDSWFSFCLLYLLYTAYTFIKIFNWSSKYAEFDIHILLLHSFLRLIFFWFRIQDWVYCDIQHPVMWVWCYKKNRLFKTAKMKEIDRTE